jgi:hypothetical protein
VVPVNSAPARPSENLALQPIARRWVVWNCQPSNSFLRLQARRGPAVSFLSIQFDGPDKSHDPPLVIPKRTRISYFAALTAATYATLRKESRMKSTEATVFDRKSGVAEGPAAAPAGNSICLSLGIRSAVRPGSRTKVSVPLVLSQNRHPAYPGLPWERSACAE